MRKEYVSSEASSPKSALLYLTRSSASLVPHRFSPQLHPRLFVSRRSDPARKDCWGEEARREVEGERAAHLQTERAQRRLIPQRGPSRGGMMWRCRRSHAAEER